jgi:hypothetical protein
MSNPIFDNDNCRKLSREELIRLSQENDDRIYGAYLNKHMPDEIEIKEIKSDGDMEVELTFSSEGKLNAYLRKMQANGAIIEDTE